MELLSKWKGKALNKVKMKMKHLKFNMKQHQIKQVLYDDEIKTYLESIHRRFRITMV